MAHIARDFHVDEKTVRKYIRRTDFSPALPLPETRPSRLDPYKSQILAWLAEDRATWPKQGHTAKRIWERLQEQHPAFDLSYLTVQRYVKAVRADGQRQFIQELVWHPGEAQVDFGEADFDEEGLRVRRKYLTVSFPYSNDSFSQVFGGETAECVCQGLQDIFAYIGGVPPVLIFDNATGVGRRVGETVHEAELFGQMRAHYGFRVRFCNPYAGHEKGHVENKIGYTRRNLFVPIPTYDQIELYNQQLLDRHRVKAQEPHYQKGTLIADLFETDRQALQPLPGQPFQVCRYQWVKADSYRKVRVDSRHYYSTCPEWGGADVLVGIRAHTIEIFSAQGERLLVHRRRFGEVRTDSLDYRTSLATLVRNVGAWPNSGLRSLVSEQLRDRLDSLTRDELRESIRTLSQLSAQYSFDTAVQALEEGFARNRTRFADTAVLAARLLNWGLDAPPQIGPDLRAYDRLLMKGVSEHDPTTDP